MDPDRVVRRLSTAARPGRPARRLLARRRHPPAGAGPPSAPAAAPAPGPAPDGGPPGRGAGATGLLAAHGGVRRPAPRICACSPTAGWAAPAARRPARRGCWPPSTGAVSLAAARPTRTRWRSTTSSTRPTPGSRCSPTRTAGGSRPTSARRSPTCRAAPTCHRRTARSSAATRSRATAGTPGWCWSSAPTATPLPAQPPVPRLVAVGGGPQPALRRGARRRPAVRRRVPRRRTDLAQDPGAGPAGAVGQPPPAGLGRRQRGRLAGRGHQPDPVPDDLAVRRHGWQPVAATGHPDRYFSVAAARRGRAAVHRPERCGRGRRRRIPVSDWPVAHADLRRLPDGTLLGRVGEDIYLGIGNGLPARWTSVVLTRCDPGHRGRVEWNTLKSGNVVSRDASYQGSP